MCRMIAGAFLMFLSLPVAAGNFSYTWLEGALGGMSLDDDVVVNGDVYDSLGVAAISGAWQLRSGIVIGLSSAVAVNDTSDTELTLSTGFFGAALPMRLTDIADLVVEAGLVGTELETCSGGLCSKDDDSGFGFGLGVRAWAIPDQFEYSFGWFDSTLDDSESVISLGAAWWWGGPHSVRLDISDSSSSTVTTLGYRYSW